MTGQERQERTATTGLYVWAPDGLPEVGAGDDLVALVLGATDAGRDLAEGDVVCLTSKVVSKSEGRVRDGERDAAIEAETVRVLARRGPTRIVRTRLGLTMAAAGVDASNVAPGSIVLLPEDPDDSARRLRAGLRERAGVNVAVVITDTAGRAWREGQTDLAIGAAGLRVAEDFAGRTDPYGNPLSVTMPAVADEIAGAAELAQGKLAARPLAIVRGRGDLVLPSDDDGPGAVALVRPEGGDLFGFGAREAVVRALAGREADRAPFGAPASLEELHAALVEVAQAHTAAPLASSLALTFDRAPQRAELHLPAGIDQRSADAVCFAFGWRIESWTEDPGTGVDAALAGVACAVSPVTT